MTEFSSREMFRRLRTLAFENDAERVESYAIESTR